MVFSKGICFIYTIFAIIKSLVQIFHLSADFYIRENDVFLFEIVFPFKNVFRIKTSRYLVPTCLVALSRQFYLFIFCLLRIQNKSIKC